MFFGIHLPKIEEAPILFELVQKNREHLRQFLGWLDESRTLQDTIKFIKNDLRKSLNLEALLLTIKFHHQPVGLVAFHEIDHHNRLAVLGYWLDQDHQGLGIMTESVNALINFSFNELKLHRIEARCLVQNFRSQRVLERLHFSREGILKDAIFHMGSSLMHTSMQKFDREPL